MFQYNPYPQNQLQTPNFQPYFETQLQNPFPPIEYSPFQFFDQFNNQIIPPPYPASHQHIYNPGYQPPPYPDPHQQLYNPSYQPPTQAFDYQNSMVNQVPNYPTSYTEHAYVEKGSHIENLLQEFDLKGPKKSGTSLDETFARQRERMDQLMGEISKSLEILNRNHSERREVEDGDNLLVDKVLDQMPSTEIFDGEEIHIVVPQLGLAFPAPKEFDENTKLVAPDSGSNNVHQMLEETTKKENLNVNSVKQDVSNLLDEMPSQNLERISNGLQVKENEEFDGIIEKVTRVQVTDGLLEDPKKALVIMEEDTRLTEDFQSSTVNSNNYQKLLGSQKWVVELPMITKLPSGPVSLTYKMRTEISKHTRPHLSIRLAPSFLSCEIFDEVAGTKTSDDGITINVDKLTERSKREHIAKMYIRRIPKKPPDSSSFPVDELETRNAINNFVFESLALDEDKKLRTIPLIKLIDFGKSTLWVMFLADLVVTTKDSIICLHQHEVAVALTHKCGTFPAGTRLEVCGNFGVAHSEDMFATLKGNSEEKIRTLVYLMVSSQMRGLLTIHELAADTLGLSKSMSDENHERNEHKKELIVKQSIDLVSHYIKYLSTWYKDRGTKIHSLKGQMGVHLFLVNFAFDQGQMLEFQTARLLRLFIRSGQNYYFKKKRWRIKVGNQALIIYCAENKEGTVALELSIFFPIVANLIWKQARKTLMEYAVCYKLVEGSVMIGISIITLWERMRVSHTRVLPIFSRLKKYYHACIYSMMFLFELHMVVHEKIILLHYDELFDENVGKDTSRSGFQDETEEKNTSGNVFKKYLVINKEIYTIRRVRTGHLVSQKKTTPATIAIMITRVSRKLYYLVEDFKKKGQNAMKEVVLDLIGEAFSQKCQFIPNPGFRVHLVVAKAQLIANQVTKELGDDESQSFKPMETGGQLMSTTKQEECLKRLLGRWTPFLNMLQFIKMNFDSLQSAQLGLMLIWFCWRCFHRWRFRHQLRAMGFKSVRLGRTGTHLSFFPLSLEIGD